MIKGKILTGSNLNIKDDEIKEINIQQYIQIHIHFMKRYFLNLNLWQKEAQSRFIAYFMHAFM